MSWRKSWGQELETTRDRSSFIHSFIPPSDRRQRPLLIPISYLFHLPISLVIQPTSLGPPTCTIPHFYSSPPFVYLLCYNAIQIAGQESPFRPRPATIYAEWRCACVTPSIIAADNNQARRPKPGPLPFQRAPARLSRLVPTAQTHPVPFQADLPTKPRKSAEPADPAPSLTHT